MSIPLPNQIKVAPKSTPAPEEPSEPSPSGTPETPKPARKGPREIRPFTQRLGKSPDLVEAFEKMGAAAKATAKATEGLKPNHPKGNAAQAAPVHNKRRTGRRVQRP